MVTEERQERGTFRRIEDGDDTKLFEHDGYDSARFGSPGKPGQVSPAGLATVSKELRTSGPNPRDGCLLLLVDHAVRTPPHEKDQHADPGEEDQAPERRPGHGQVAFEHHHQEQHDNEAQEATGTKRAFQLRGGPANDGERVDGIRGLVVLDPAILRGHDMSIGSGTGRHHDCLPHLGPVEPHPALQAIRAKREILDGGQWR